MKTCKVGILVLTWMGLVSGCSSSSNDADKTKKPLDNPTKKASDEQKEISLKPAFSTTAAKLAKEYQADVKAAEKKYKEKVVGIEGIVDGNMVNYATKTFLISLAGHPDNNNPDTKVRLVECKLRKDLVEKVDPKSITKGAKIKLIGRCKGIGEICDVSFEDCEGVRVLASR